MDPKLKSTIDKIVRLAAQDTEYASALRQALGATSPKEKVAVEDERIRQIYEYCIQDVIRRQAEDFYADFPLTTIVPELIDDYCRMEIFRRKNQFGDFCLAMYQQIENITNRLCSKDELNEIASKFWAYPAYVKAGKNITPTIGNRQESDYSVGALVLLGKDKAQKASTALQSQYALDKIRAVVYFLGYKAQMKSSDYDSFKEVTDLLADLYQCRNMNHRGNTLNIWEEEILNRVLSMPSFYYFKFIGVFTQYIEFIRNVYHEVKEILKYTRTLPDKKLGLAGPTILGKIDLDALNARTRPRK